MAVTMFPATAATATDSSANQSLTGAYAGTSTTGVYGFSSTTPGLNTIAGALPYNGQPFVRYLQQGQPVSNGTLVVDVVFPRGRDNEGASYCVVYTFSSGALT